MTTGIVSDARRKLPGPGCPSTRPADPGGRRGLGLLERKAGKQISQPRQILVQKKNVPPSQVRDEGVDEWVGTRL